jgi:hypothetical protein
MTYVVGEAGDGCLCDPRYFFLPAFACAYAVPVEAAFALLSCFGFFFSRLLFCSLLMWSLSLVKIALRRLPWLQDMQGGIFSALAPFARLDIERHLSFGAHSHQKVLQGVSALAAGINALLQRVNRQWLFQRGQHIRLTRHRFCLSI